jgi:hypothetical protein
MAKNHRFNTDKSIHPENDLGLGNQLTGNYRLLDENGKFKLDVQVILYDFCIFIVLG